MADGRFGCEADMAGPAAGSTRSLVTQSVHRLPAYAAMRHPESIEHIASRPSFSPRNFCFAARPGFQLCIFLGRPIDP
jgi:hypothetical protein